MAGFRFVPKLTPHGRLALTEPEDAPEPGPESAQRLGEAFARGSGVGWLQLGAREAGETLPGSFACWRDFAGRFMVASCGRQLRTRRPQSWRNFLHLHLK